ncbi:hypothetical protein N7468_007645 [Penicillium chermesinum]|uniref:Uncharacterized protein n=1 Tax=Penicillium chermesinum TaxID=63820 RepID=A0A9W9NUR0_9EURO|nr:uncharacterized protein N7468_007645 [Penicillium chermesinum]KAJ5226420.1 hypothetical protein N7468_007645 [Penicillium chermesinum]
MPRFQVPESPEPPELLQPPEPPEQQGLLEQPSRYLLRSQRSPSERVAKLRVPDRGAPKEHERKAHRD